MSLAERRPKPWQVCRRRRQHPLVALVGEVLGAGIEGDSHQLVLADALRDHHHALAVELPRDGSGLGHRPAVAGEEGADVGAGAVSVVGQGLHDEGHPDGA